MAIVIPARASPRARLVSGIGQSVSLPLLIAVDAAHGAEQSAEVTCVRRVNRRSVTRRNIAGPHLGRYQLIKSVRLQERQFCEYDSTMKCCKGRGIEPDGLSLRRYATQACSSCKLRKRCTTSSHRSIARWEHEHVFEDVQRRLDENPQAMRMRRETVEHPFGTIKARMGATHFLMKRLKNVKTEMALAVLAYNLTRVMNIIGIGPLLKAIQA